MASKEEPSYMMFARANVRGGISSSPIIVRELLQRIDRLELEKSVEPVVVEFQRFDKEKR